MCLPTARRGNGVMVITRQNVEIFLINFWAGHFFCCDRGTVLPAREVHIPGLAVSVICLDSLDVNDRMAVS
jgi:hypothetical protein